MFKVKNKLTVNQIADIYNINEESTNSKRYNLRNADFVLPRFKTVTYGRHSLRFLGPQLWSKLSKEERNIGTLATFRTMIRKKDVTSNLVLKCKRVLSLNSVNFRLYIYIYYIYIYTHTHVLYCCCCF